VLGSVEEILRGCLLDDLAGVHDRDVVGGLRDDTHVVRDHDHRHRVFLAELLEQVENAGLNRHVERRGRLVGDQQLRVARDCHRNHHALAHPARVAMWVIVETAAGVRDVHLLEQLDGPLSGLLPGKVQVTAERLRDLRPDRQRRIERGHRILEDHRDLQAPDVLHLPALQRRELLPVEERGAGDHSARGLHESHDRECRHRLSAARLADDP
jgi:hypothetical protein